MLALSHPEEISNWVGQQKKAGKTIALVPTMGALHKGHLELVRRAKESADRVIVSVFVNPTQFGEGEDYEKYPRNLDKDKNLLRDLSVDLVFAPEVNHMYSGNDRSVVVVKSLDEYLCGRFRPGHFQGVTTIVTKLFHICQPDVAVFGLKDAQQFFILRRMVNDLSFGVVLIGVPTVRESDGLAMSSRNRFLSPEARNAAPVLYRTLKSIQRRISAGEGDAAQLISYAKHAIGEEPLAHLQYLEIVDTELLQPVEELKSGIDIIVAAAAYFGETRLIDNIIMEITRTKDIDT